SPLAPPDSPAAGFAAASLASFSSIRNPQSAIRILEVSFLEFIGEVIARAPGERHDRPRRVLARGVDVAAAVNDEEVLDVVRLLKLVEHRSLRIVAHARRAEFMN